MAGGQQPQENDVPVYLFTGFLEAGKTKFIQETLEDKRFNSGEKTMLLLCEEGEEEYDIAIVRSTHDKTGKLGFLNVLARIYLTVIRGTPVVVQLLIIYFVIFASVNVGKTFVAVLAFDLLALGVAGWMRYVGGVDEQENPIEISDPLLPVIQKAVQSSAEGKARVQSLLAIKAIFGDDLPDNSLFTAKVTEAYLSLLAHGAKATVAKYSVK